MASQGWSYEGAFIRNRGLIRPEEQEKLRNTHVAIVGMGGVGGVDLVTLARLGVGRFTIADPDVFNVPNFNRQYGATVATLGQNKAEVMAAIVHDINPEADVRVIAEPVGKDNADEFLRDANLLVDGIDAFEIEVRRVLFAAAARKGIYAIGAGPVGFSTVWVIIDPGGMSFDRYFDLLDDMDDIDKFASYIVGMAPAGTHRRYIDLSFVDFRNRYGPSSALACQLASGVVGAEVLKILLKRGPVYPAPYYHQFDVYVGRYVRRRLLLGNRGPLQRVKRRLLARFLRARAAC
jgi:molybdopterin/thiamine biosynthesis adenylyltransferase